MRQGAPSDRCGIPFPASRCEQPLESVARPGEDLTFLILQARSRLREPRAPQVLGAAAHSGAPLCEGDVHLTAVARVWLALDEAALFESGDGGAHGLGPHAFRTRTLRGSGGGAACHTRR